MEISEIKFPCAGAYLQRAKDYAEKSINHTKVYGGWDKEQIKTRIITGRFGQEWMQGFCALNGIPYKADETSPEHADDFDLMINGQIVDVKTSTQEYMWPQVPPHLENKSEKFIFLKTDSKFRYVTFQGWIPATYVFVKENFVAKGKPIPGAEALLNRYESGSYFVSPVELFGVEYFMTVEKRGVKKPDTLITDYRTREKLGV